MDALDTLEISQTNRQNNGTVIFLHGAGGSGESLAEWLEWVMKQRFSFSHLKIIYPTAPEILYKAAGNQLCNIWFDWEKIDINFSENLSSIDKMCKKIDGIIEDEVSSGLNVENIIIGGLSMGGIMAMHYCLRHRCDIKNMFILSTFLPRNSAVYKCLADTPNEKRPRVFQCHGSIDKLIPEAWGKETYETLKSLASSSWKIATGLLDLRDSVLKPNGILGCSVNYCKNGGTCVPSLLSSCICPRNFKGSKCEIEIKRNVSELSVGEYIGCSKYEHAKNTLKNILSLSKRKGTASQCISHCKKSNYTLATVHVGKIYRMCGCSSKMPKKFKGKCNYQCPGDKSEECGGKSSLSVYATGNISNSCPDFTYCTKQCLYGYKVDPYTDCFRCQCEKDPCKNMICPRNQVCKANLDDCASIPCGKVSAQCYAPLSRDKDCPRVRCRLVCIHGYLSDEKGCEICSCNTDPCKGIKCPDQYVCIEESTLCEAGNRFCSQHNLYINATSFNEFLHGNITQKGGPGAWGKNLRNIDPGKVWGKQKGKRRGKKGWVKNILRKTKGVCRATVKKGSCPLDLTYDYATYPTDIYDSDGKDSWCAQECESDIDCSGILKCCQNECGSQCVIPDLEDITFCQVQREEAITTNSSFVPECDEEGNFEPVQCRKLGVGKNWRGFNKGSGKRGYHWQVWGNRTIIFGRNKNKSDERGQRGKGRGERRGWKGNKGNFLKHSEICWCVDVGTGEQNKFEIGFNKTALKCDELPLNECQVKTCMMENGREEKKCEFGFETDDVGCPSCLCKENPCSNYPCKDGRICELVRVSCNDATDCQPIPVCFEPNYGNVACPKGEVYRDLKSARIVTCNNYKSDSTWPNSLFAGILGRAAILKDDPAATFQNQTNVCPKKYKCLYDKKTGLGVCCPNTDNDDRLLKCQQPKKPGNCNNNNKYVTRYFFNTKSKVCESFSYSGCDGNSNNFETYKKCKDYCEDKPGICPWKSSYIHYYYRRSYKKECSHDLDCKEDRKCCKSAFGQRCMNPLINSTGSCAKAKEAAIQVLKASPSSPIMIPRCKLSGEWGEIQCLDSLGVCWCVDKNGKQIKGTVVRGRPNCNSTTSDDSICPPDTTIRKCSYNLCARLTCPGNPLAVCRIDPCGHCRPKFFDTKNREVDCKDNLQPCERRKYTGRLKAREFSGRLYGNQSLYQYSNKYYTPTHTHPAIGEKRGNRIIYDDLWYYDRDRFISTNQLWNHNCPTYKIIYYRSTSGCTHECSKNSDCLSGTICCYEKCARKCVQPAPSVCDMPPKIKCRKTKDRGIIYNDYLFLYNYETYYFDKQSSRCKKLANATNCSLSGKNKFSTEQECLAKCSSYHYMQDVISLQCINKKFKSKQCYSGFCWCITQDGKPVEGTLTKASLKCTADGQIEDRNNFVPVICPDNRKPKICQDDCLKASCAPRRSGVTCLADPCNNCKVSFKTRYSMKNVTCKDLEACEWSCGGNLCKNGETPKICPDACKDAVCLKFPEALCYTDPCTCKPTFISVKYNGPISCTEDTTPCQRMVIDTERIHLLSRNSNITNKPFVPECDENGNFKPLQCHMSMHVCWCVTEQGFEINGTKALLTAGDRKPSCNKETGKVERASVTIIMQDDFNLIKNDLTTFSNIWRQELLKILEIGDDNIRDMALTSGSIHLSFNVLADHVHDLWNGISLLRELTFFGKLFVSYNDKKFVAADIQTNLTQFGSTPTMSPDSRTTPQPTHARIIKENDKVVVKEEGSMTVYIIAGIGAILAVICLCLLAAFIIRRRLAGVNNDAPMSFSNNIYEPSKREGQVNITQDNTDSTA
ncbi:DgyrCDS10382 [Dimorphilus gyrociliatus]|uniref:palmitoyl-protein hydrolase n=1 Tax=Dimorphilus gyrociliatus TaxID=2664684 RepID=A0A7I8W162_9ANNE|nr:DgyrCDS10382 [Dimorphilus gyrociliatus]